MKRETLKSLGRFRGAYCLLLTFVLCGLLFAVGASAADKLLVKDSGGVNTTFVVTDETKVGVNVASPLYHYDLSSGGAVKSSMHFSQNGTDVGGWITSVGDTNFFLSAGAVYDASLGGWIQKSSSGVAAVLGGDSPGFTIYTASGTAVGAIAPVASRLRISAAGNIGIATNAPTQKLDVNSNGIRVRNSNTPASSSASCNQGDISWDSNYVYVCVTTNFWRRSALSSW